MMFLFLFLLLAVFFCLGHALPNVCDEDAASTSFLQVDSVFRASKLASSQQASGKPNITLVQKPGTTLLEDTAADQVEAMMSQMRQKWAEEGLWGTGALQPHKPGCGQATPEELQMTIPAWQQQHPGVRGFCHFSNYGFWFPEDDQTKYSLYKYQSQTIGPDTPKAFGESGGVCQAYGPVAGPEVTINYDNLSFTWNHARDCIDIVDDPYCYSLGWLKGQNLDGTLMENKTAWHLLAKSECQKIQDEFQFLDEEVSVGRHVESTPVYFAKTWCSLTGRCSGVTRRIHKEHVYTKCQLGAESGEYAASELAYCYHKACVLPGNRIGHSKDCNYGYY